MNPMMKRLEAIEEAHAAQGGDRIRVFIRNHETETAEQARERLGLTDWPGVLVLLEPGCEKI